MTSTVITNNNGRQYVVLKQRGNYTLLAQTNCRLDEYVIAAGLKMNPSGKCEWNYGSYFWELGEAVREYLRKAGGEE